VGHSSIECVNKLSQRMYDEIAICHRHALIDAQVVAERSEPAREWRGLTGTAPAIRRSQSRKPTLRRELLIFKPPLYSMNPSFRNLFMKKFTRERVVPTISASVSCDTFGSVR
jgi:hypothetical protein